MDSIPDATCVEFEGEDHCAWIMPNRRELDDEVTVLVIGSTPAQSTTRHFGTVMSTDIVDSTRQSSALGDTALEWESTR